jgi:hypothetical protein
MQKRFTEEHIFGILREAEVDGAVSIAPGILDTSEPLEILLLVVYR